MSFFEPPPPPDVPETAFVRKPWWGAPTNELGVSTGLRLVLARTEDAVLALLDAVAFSEGVDFTLSVLRRVPAEPEAFDNPFAVFMPTRKAGAELPPDLLRLGVQFAEWPSEGIELTRHEVDAAPTLEAGRSSMRPWPECKSPDGGAWTTRERLGG